jgi:hypothetical protein
MTLNEITTFQSLLKTKATETIKVLRNREGIIVEGTADEFDEIAIEFERDIAVEHLHSESALPSPDWMRYAVSKRLLLERACTVRMHQAETFGCGALGGILPCVPGGRRPWRTSERFRRPSSGLPRPRDGQVLINKSPSGFRDMALGMKQQCGPLAGALDLSVIAGVGMPTGTGRASSHSVDPFITFPWSSVDALEELCFLID